MRPVSPNLKCWNNLYRILNGLIAIRKFKPFSKMFEGYFCLEILKKLYFFHISKFRPSKICPQTDFTKFELFPAIKQILWRGVEASLVVSELFLKLRMRFFDSTFLRGWHNISNSTSPISLKFGENLLYISPYLTCLGFWKIQFQRIF